MFWYFAVGMLAAYGAVCALWTLFGWLLPSGAGCAVVCIGQPEAEVFARFRWLKEMGFLKIPVIVVTEAAEGEDPRMEICRREDLVSRLEWEWERVHGTGNGDHTGRNQRCGLSEL